MGVCMEVAAPIANCITYATPSSCLVCNAGHYMSNGNCVRVVNQVSFCETFDQNQRCVKCQYGKVLDTNTGLCINYIERLNCSNFSFKTCQRCKDGYMVDHNNYINSYFNINSKDDFKKLEAYHINQQTNS
jgi:hypothetical protein